MTILPCGTPAVLVEVADLHEVNARYGALRADPPTGGVDLVSAAAVGVGLSLPVRVRGGERGSRARVAAARRRRGRDRREEIAFRGDC